MSRIEAETQEAAVGEGKRRVRERAARVDAWAFAREGLLRLRNAEDARDALVVEFGARGEDVVYGVIQPFEPFASNGRFRIVGDTMVMRDGNLLDGEDAAALLRLLQQGIDSHPAVVERWASWRT